MNTRWRARNARRDCAAWERNASAVAAAEELLWEVERAEPASLEELEPDVDRMDRPSRPERGRPQARRTALELAVLVRLAADLKEG